MNKRAAETCFTYLRFSGLKMADILFFIAHL